jgi:hypothetical protein
MDTKKKKRTTDYTDITDGFSHENREHCACPIPWGATLVSIPIEHS